MKKPSLKPIILAIPLVVSTVNASETKNVQPHIERYRDEAKRTLFLGDLPDQLSETILSFNHPDAKCSITTEEWKPVMTCSSDKAGLDSGGFYSCDFVHPAELTYVTCSKVDGYEITNSESYVYEGKFQIWFEYTRVQEK